MAKTERIEMRATPEEHELILQAASLSHTSASAFVLEAARAAANRVLARADVTLMPEDQYEELLAALDQPTEIPNLAGLAAKPRRFRRR
ncbi:DUF1778 domain-containing protein [Dactylosporangium sp. CA-139114]|uniref:type II toxin-antitoxin system TacA family antitoxin n=1 Tax=Dactylosporangium sp. CA-139114 TaxID=3239931 RepID=UPI003D98CC61